MHASSCDKMEQVIEIVPIGARIGLYELHVVSSFSSKLILSRPKHLDGFAPSYE